MTSEPINAMSLRQTTSGGSGGSVLVLNSGSSSVNADHGKQTGGRISLAGPGFRRRPQEDVMVQTLLIVPTGAGVHLARTCLGLVRALDRRGVNVAFAKPVAQPRPRGGTDRSAALAAVIAPLDPPEPLSTARLEHLLGEGGLDAALENIVATLEPVHDRSDVVVVEALTPSPARLYAVEINQVLARALDADVLLVARWSAPDAGSGEDQGHGAAKAGEDPIANSIESLAETLAITAGGFWSGENARVVGCLVNGVPEDPATAAQLSKALDRRGLRLIAAVPHRPELTWLRVLDLIRELGPQVLGKGDLSRRIKEVAVFAQGVPGGLRVLTEGRLVVVPGDRHEVVMAACLAELNGTHLAALLLCAGIPPDPQVWELTQAASATGLPILVVDDDSYQTATRVRDLDPGLPVDDLARIEGEVNNIADALNVSWLESLPGTKRPRRLSPAAFRYQLAELARAADACVVLPEGTEPRTVQAAVACAERGIARSVLLGPPDEVAGLARSLGLRLPDGVTVVDPQDVAERYVAPLVRLRRHRGWTEEIAREHLADPIMVGTMMLQQGEVDGMVSGAVHTTAATIRPALQILGTRPGSRLVSSVFYMCLPDEVVIYGDCAINPRPDAEDLADIAISSAGSARAIGIEPRVAMISFSTGTSGVGSDVDKVAEATRIVRERAPELAIDGPLQYDAAAIASVGQAKRPGSPVAGRANVFIFPDLDTGNTTYKAVQRSAHVVSVGPMLQGLAKPVNDLSRGAQVEDIIYTVALTAIQSRAK
jgi:phosphate acetyltransferase